MNILWTKDKYQKIFSTENVVFHASGDAAAANRCCRICGSDASLRAAGDTYTCNGVEERYDRLLFSCFGVTVSPPDSLLCECCVRQLRNTDRFRSLVYAALDRPASSSNITTETRQPKKEESASISYKDIVELLSNTTSGDKGRKRFENRHALRSVSRTKRVTVECVICKKMFHPFLKDTESFICTRCRRNLQCNCQKLGVYSQASGSNTAIKRSEMLVKRDLRRWKSSPKNKPSLPKCQEQKIRGVPKYKCPVCPKKYMTSQHLVEHIKFIHGSRWNSFCGICCAKIRNESYEKHIQLHVEIANPKKSVKLGRSKQALNGNLREKAI